MNPFRPRLLILYIVSAAGCQHSAVIDSEPRRGEAATQSTEVFDPQKDFGKEVTVEGILEGQWIYGASRSGATFGSTMKGDHPLRIRYKSVDLPLLAVSDEVAELLVAQAGNVVRLQGRIGQIQDYGRKTPPSSQQGYTGPIPGHTVYYLDVTSCEPKHPSATNK